MSFYGDMAAVALRLLTSKGQTVSIRTRSTDDYDPSTGEVLQTETTEAGVGVLLPSGQLEAVVDQDPARIVDTAQWVVAASGITAVPTPGDSIDGDGASWAIIAVTPSSPAGTPIVYKLLVKKMRTAVYG